MRSSKPGSSLRSHPSPSTTHRESVQSNPLAHAASRARFCQESCIPGGRRHAPAGERCAPQPWCGRISMRTIADQRGRDWTAPS
jgi:hypothetical protein